MKKITLEAYAKINLHLDVTGIRDDGYHLLETVMHTVSLSDTVTIEKTDGGITVSCSDKNIPCNEKNIAYKCADAFFKEAGITDSGVSITIEKRIPSQAGMGGGSADGAAVLKGMNELFDTVFSVEKLCETGARLGADIPFCIVGGCGYCTGIGEIITPLPSLEEIVVIGKGNTGISTADAFKKIDSSPRTTNYIDIKSLFSDNTDLRKAAPLLRNIFDEVTELDEVMKIKNTMTDGGAYFSAMTGSGSAVFGVFDEQEDAERVCRTLKTMGFFSQICKFV